MASSSHFARPSMAPSSSHLARPSMAPSSSHFARPSMAAASATHYPTGEPIPITEQLMQLDQAITLTLQEIDANFAKSHQIITSKILPAVKRYGVASMQTWDNARFWKAFFESSANVKLSNAPDDATTTAEDTSTHSGTGEASVDRSQYSFSSQQQDVSYGREGIGGEDPRDDNTSFLAAIGTAAQSSPAKSLRGKGAIPPPADGPSFSSSADSPFEKFKREVASEFGHGNDHSSNHTSDLSTSPFAGAGTNPSSDDSLALPPPSNLLHKVLVKNHLVKNHRVVVETTPRAARNPFKPASAGQRWDGIADLRTTGLNNKGAPKTPESDYDSDDSDLFNLPQGMSPPCTMQFSIPRSRYTKTPAKEAARLMVDDLLRTVGGKEDSALWNGEWKGGAGGMLDDGTPVRGGGGGGRSKGSRRDSLPTPPTLTRRLSTTPQVQAPSLLRNTGTGGGGSSAASMLLDSGEGGEGDDGIDWTLQPGARNAASSSSTAPAPAPAPTPDVFS